MAKLLLHLTAVLESKSTIGEVLGIQEREEEHFPNYTTPPTGESRCELSEQDREEWPEERSARLSASASAKPQRRIEPLPSNVDALDLSHVSDWPRDKFRRVLKKYTRIWDETLRQINTMVRVIELAPKTRPIAQAPYRAGPKAREVQDAEFKKMLDAGVIEPAQSEWASPALLVPKPGGSMRFA